jgi:beta-apo-4'-carotenal oxygenase
VGWLLNDIIFMTNNLEKWAKDEPAPDMIFVNKFMSPIIRKDPMGCVLIIGYSFLRALSELAAY